MNTTIAINKPKVRQSNFELLRIIAMFMVLILHADFIALGAPDKEDLLSEPISSWIKVIIEMGAIVAVNVFVLISGWFGIHSNVRSFTQFIFQFVFFALGTYIILLVSGQVEVSVRGFAESFGIIPGSYWFISSYCLLYILSPFLNLFINNSDKRRYLLVLILFYAIQTLYTFLCDGKASIVNGYSVISFIGLYLLSGFIKKFINYKSCNRLVYLICYLVVTFLLTILYIAAKYYGNINLAGRLIAYSNPLVVISSLMLLLYFARVNLSNRFVNYVAISSFSVYLLHCNPNLFYIYLKSIRNIDITYSILYVLQLFLVMSLWFVTAIFIDKIRLWVWNKLCRFSIIKNSIEF